MNKNQSFRKRVRSPEDPSKKLNWAGSGRVDSRLAYSLPMSNSPVDGSVTKKMQECVPQRMKTQKLGTLTLWGEKKKKSASYTKHALLWGV